ncbi:MAG: hypothetical protein GY792_36290 [Gammaproteobacteria bacterium]|nr:hypothetical protein [Gammaproteobacteria bacterium]
MLPVDQASLTRLQSDIHQALKQWHKAGSDDSPLAGLLLFQQARHDGSGSIRQTTNQLLLAGLKQLETESEAGARLLRMRFLDEMTVVAVANQLNVAEITVHRNQKAALNHLARIIGTQEEQRRTAQRSRLAQRLEPPSYDELIGVEPHLKQLLKRLVAPEPPWLISIEGLGGLGKTSLADAICRRLIEHDQVDDLGWVSARQRVLNLGGAIQPVAAPALTAEDLIEKLLAQLLPEVWRSGPLQPGEAQAALQTHLSRQRPLIVIDNLETVTDVESLLPTLRQVANPAKVLLTSRESLHYEPGLFHFQLPDLSRSAALHLIRHEAALHNLPYLAQADDTELEPIYETAGGNPLALRLVVGQTHVQPLAAVLGDLTAARGRQVETLYRFIYRQAWGHLAERERQVLLAMPLVPVQGGSLGFLTGLVELERGQVVTALNTLVKLNLINAVGGLTERRYTIHNLTRTFLQKQVARWS